jgi:hypothetical protein
MWEPGDCALLREIRRGWACPCTFKVFTLKRRQESSRSLSSSWCLFWNGHVQLDYSNLKMKQHHISHCHRSHLPLYVYFKLWVFYLLTSDVKFFSNCTSPVTPWSLIRRLQPGVTTDEIDKAVHQMIIDAGAYPSPLGYGGFPKSVCTSVNECICHGIPDSRPLQVCSPLDLHMNFKIVQRS